MELDLEMCDFLNRVVAEELDQVSLDLVPSFVLRRLAPAKTPAHRAGARRHNILGIIRCRLHQHGQQTASWARILLW